MKYLVDNEAEFVLDYFYEGIIFEYDYDEMDFFDEDQDRDDSYGDEDYIWFED